MLEALIIENNISLQQAIDNQLKELDYHTHVAATLSEAQSFLQENTVNLAVISEELPDGLGFEFWKGVKGNRAFTNTQAIIVTKSNYDYKKRTFESGALAYLPKDEIEPSLKNLLKNITSVIGTIQYPGSNVLLIIGDEFQRNYIKGLIEFTNLKVFDFAEVEPALYLLKNDAPFIDIVLIDCNKSNDYLPLIEYLKDSDLYSQAPVLIITTSEMVSFKYEFSVFGISDFILKPFDSGEFYLKLRTHLRTKYIMDLLDAKSKLLTISAITDELTMLYNRRFFLDNLKREDNRHRRKNTTYSVIMLDIDYFKKINDNFGHNTGDMVLVSLAKTIKSNIRSIDILSRYGGEEFIILLPETNKKSAVNVANKLLNTVKSMKLDFRKEPITVSMGVASSDEVGSYEEIISVADERLYKAKNNGRDRVEYE